MCSLPILIVLSLAGDHLPTAESLRPTVRQQLDDMHVLCIPDCAAIVRYYQDKGSIETTCSKKEKMNATNL